MTDPSGYPFAIPTSDIEARDRARIDADHVGPMIVGAPEQVERNAMAMSFHDAHYAVDCGIVYRGPLQHEPDAEGDYPA